MHKKWLTIERNLNFYVYINVFKFDRWFPPEFWMFVKPSTSRIRMVRCVIWINFWFFHLFKIWFTASSPLYFWKTCLRNGFCRSSKSSSCSRNWSNKYVLFVFVRINGEAGVGCPICKEHPEAARTSTNSLIYKVRTLSDIISFLNCPVEQQMAHYLLKVVSETGTFCSIKHHSRGI